MAVPKLKFKADDGSEFPEWEEKCIDTEFDFYNGVAHENNVVEKGKYIVVNSKFISSDGKIKKYSDVANFPLMIDDIVMVMSDVPNGKAIAKCFLIDKNDTYTLNQRICCLRTKHNAIFMLNQINRNNYFLRFDDGIKQTNLRKEDILRCPIYVPSVLEQQKMAEFLYTIDEIIQSTESELTAWQERKKGVMQKIFNSEVRFKADDGSEFPEWEEKRLGEEGQFYGGLSGKGKADFGCGEGRFLTYMNIYKNAFAKRDIVDNVNVGKTEKQNSVQYGDILFTQSSETVEEVGLSSVYLYDDKPYLNSFCMGFRFNDLRNICPEFIGYCMRSENVRKSIMLMGQGISRINLGAKRLATVKYELPSLPEQRKIADCLSSLDDVINQIKAELSAWKEFKKGLLQQMFV